MLRILPEHQHLIRHQPDLVNAVNVLHHSPLCFPLRVIHLKERLCRKIAHLIGIPDNINRLPENLMAVAAVSFFCQ